MEYQSRCGGAITRHGRRASRKAHYVAGAIALALIVIVAGGCNSPLGGDSGGGKSDDADQGAVVEGYAYDPGGEEAGIEVTLEEVEGGQTETVVQALSGGDGLQIQGGRFGRRTTTNRDGRYRFGGVAAGRYSVHARSQGGNHAFVINIIVAGNVTIEINPMVLGPVGNISGTVTLAGDEPDEGIMVYIPGTSFLAMSDADGNYTITNVPESEEGESYTLVCARDEYMNARTASISVVAGETTTVDPVELDPSSHDPYESTAWHTDSGPPTSELGEDGDFYLDLDNGDVWQKVAGVWEPRTNLTGPEGPQGEKGDQGEPGEDGADGQDGASIVWMGELAAPPADPFENCAYYNTTDGVTYIYDGTEWDILAQDGHDGQDGEDGADGLDGLSIIWMGELSSPPTGSFGKGPYENWAYYDIEDGISYIYDGTEWDILAQDGQDGEDGLSIVWRGERSSHPSSPQENWAYYNSTDNKSYIYDGSSWQILSQDVTAPEQYENLTIGDRGPAGGLVFYDKGFYSDGWRYMEAAPRHTEFKGVMWGGYGTYVLYTEPDIGSGAANTQHIFDQLGYSGMAAAFCLDLVSGGYDDWFLPSLNELMQMNLNLDDHEADLGEFINFPGPAGDFDGYWSSTEYNVFKASQVDFSSNVVYDEDKNNATNEVARAARMF